MPLDLEDESHPNCRCRCRGSNEVTRHFEIVQDDDTNTREKTNALSCLMQSYDSRLQILTAGPESYMNIMKSISEIDLQRRLDGILYDDGLVCNLEKKPYWNSYQNLDQL